MKLTLSVIKADIGSIGGHVAPSKRLRETVEAYIRDRAPSCSADAQRRMSGRFLRRPGWPGV